MIGFRTRQGLRLVGDGFGNPRDPPVLFLHGGGQTRHSWGDVARRIAVRGWYSVCIDLRGHGDSEYAPDGRYGYAVMADDVIDIVAELGARSPVLVGASLGGLAALIAVGEKDQTAARGLVLVDVAPRVEPAGSSEIRAFMRANPDGFAVPADAADAIAAYLPDRERRIGKGLMKNLRLREDGRYYWHWDPRLLADENLPPPDSQKRLERAAGRISIPTLLIRGGRSRILSEKGVDELRTLIPHSEYVNIRQAGHMVAGDANDDFGAPLLSFLQSHF